MKHAIYFLFIFTMFAAAAFGQQRQLSGRVVASQFELVPNVRVEISDEQGNIVTTAETDGEGRFSAAVPNGTLRIKAVGRNIADNEQTVGADGDLADVTIRVVLRPLPVSESVTIRDEALSPTVDFRNDTIYKNSLFTRDDQMIFTLNAGINAGQHEGGGKSLEIRRFGFNTDHGGVNGGLKILIDNFPQNQGTQGHGQGYLGDLKSLSPELVEEIDIVNGPFSAAYGDFSGLGVVHIRLKESLPDEFTLRLQGGSFNTFRGFFAYSPRIKDTAAVFAYEPSYTDGPFDHPLKYRRDNFTANVMHKFTPRQTAGVKLNFGRNDFYSSGQIPLDEVADGRLGRFGAIDPDNGGRVRTGRAGVYYRFESDRGDIFRADAHIARSLFDLFSNFTFYLADPIYGDEIQQHDSRLQQAANVQYVRPYGSGKVSAVFTAGGGMHLNQINVGLYPSIGRDPRRKFLPENIDNPNVLMTSANARVNNFSGYVQNSAAFFSGKLRFDAGLRIDHFGYRVNGFELGGTDVKGETCNSGYADPVTPENPCAVILDGHFGDAKLQPKLAVAYSPFAAVPVSFYANYGRGISSQDARGVVRRPDAPKLSTTDFYQTGAAYNGPRFAAVFTAFLIDRSNEQVYIPDDGGIEFAGRSRSYGVEFRETIKLHEHLSLNGGVTQVINAFYPGEFTADGRRVIVDSAPRTVANAGLVLTELKGFNGTLNWRHISNYRLDGHDPTIKAAGHDVVDLSVTKRLTRWAELNFAIDNLLNKKYYETQNYFESRILAGEKSPVGERIHATPGYPFTASVGVTFRFGRR